MPSGARYPAVLKAAQGESLWPKAGRGGAPGSVANKKPLTGGVKGSLVGKNFQGCWLASVAVGRG
jgi:hypothetical protein